MADKQRRTETTPDRDLAESIAAMIAKMGIFTADEVEKEVWSRVGGRDREDILPPRNRIIAEMIARLNPFALVEVEATMWSLLDDRGREEMLAIRLRCVAESVNRMLAKMTPGEAQGVKTMISARLGEAQ